MSTTAIQCAEAAAIVGEGWRTLVDHLGIQKATQFVVLLERGKGDSVQEITEFWGNATIEEIHARVQAWKADLST